MTRLWFGRVARASALLGICAAVARGQVAEPTSDTTPGGAHTAACHGEPVSRIDIETRPPFEATGGAVTARLARALTDLHSTTRPYIIRHYLALDVGQPCTDFRVTESQRILRAQPFLADATVVATPDGKGGMIITVVTIDETSLILDGSGSTKPPIVRAARLGDENVGGAAISASGAWQHGELFRDIFKARVVDYQFLGRPYQLSLQGARDELGGSWDVLVSHPFFTDLQRASWRTSAGSSTGYYYFERPAPSTEEPALQFTRSYADVGGVFAVGPIRHIFLIGGTLSRERERTGRYPMLVTDSGLFNDTSTTLVGRYGEHRSDRINLLLGYRNVKFLTVNDFDAVNHDQDVRTGVQIAGLFGRGLKLTDDDERDYFLSTDIYAGGGTPQSFGAIEFLTERRRDLDTRQWDGILASGRAAWYAHPFRKHTSVIDFEYGSGSKQRVPFQLTLSDRDGGIPGYGWSDYGGAERAVVRMEDRYRIGNYRQFAALAVAPFVDGGKLWAGDAPFGVTTGVKVSAGVSLLAALPPRSRRTWRMDVAVPLNDHTAGHRRVELRFTTHDFTQWFWREPGDIQTSRERSIPNSVYNWP